MESEICSKFAKIGTTNPSFKKKIDQNSDEGTENATKTFLNYVNISKLNIWLLYFCLILVNFGILSMTKQTRCLCVIGYLSRFEIKCPFISCTLLLKLMCRHVNVFQILPIRCARNRDFKLWESRSARVLYCIWNIWLADGAIFTKENYALCWPNLLESLYHKAFTNSAFLQSLYLYFDSPKA